MGAARRMTRTTSRSAAESPISPRNSPASSCRSRAFSARSESTSLRAAHEGADLLVVERLGDVAVRALAQRAHRRPLVAVRGDEHEERVGMARAHLLQQRQPVHGGHGEVAQHQVRRRLLQRGERGRRVLRLAHLVPVALQQLRQREPDRPLVVNDQDSHERTRREEAMTSDEMIRDSASLWARGAGSGVCRKRIARGTRPLLFSFIQYAYMSACVMTMYGCSARARSRNNISDRSLCIAPVQRLFPDVLEELVEMLATMTPSSLTASNSNTPPLFELQLSHRECLLHAFR